MAHRYGERQQTMLFPQSIENYIAKDDTVRVYDAFVDALDWPSLGIVCDKKIFKQSQIFGNMHIRLNILHCLIEN